VARSYVREARRRGLGRRRERIGRIVERLAAEHADAEIALRFRTDLELLVSVMLSAQTTDVNVNRVTPALFRRYRTPDFETNWHKHEECELIVIEGAGHGFPGELGVRAETALLDWFDSHLKSPLP